MARPSCLRLFWHLIREAASRTFCTAGSRSPMSIAMIAITTSNSMSVKARRDSMADLGWLGLWRERPLQSGCRAVFGRFLGAFALWKAALWLTRDHERTPRARAPDQSL